MSGSSTSKQDLTIERLKNQETPKQVLIKTDE